MTGKRRARIAGQGEGGRLEGLDLGLNEFIERACRLEPLSQAEAEGLHRRMRAGDRAARERLIMHNMRLAVFVARRFRGRGVPDADLVQEASIGLARGVDKWDPRRGALSTVAVWWIRKQVQVAISNTGDAIRVPTHVAHRRSLALKQLRLNPESTREEIALALGVEMSQLDAALGIAEVVASLDREIPQGDGYAEALANLLADPNAEDPADYALREDPAVREALGRLDREQREVVEMRYGFRAVGPMSFSEIGEALGMTREDASKRHGTAMARLRRFLSDPGKMTLDVGEIAEGRATLERGYGETSSSSQDAGSLVPAPLAPGEEDEEEDGGDPHQVQA